MQTNIDQEIRNYLNQVKQNLGHLPSARRDALLSELESHINDALRQRVKSETPTLADIKAIIAEMDSPDSFKQIANDGARGENPSYTLGKLALGISLVSAVLMWIPYLGGFIALAGVFLQVGAFIIGVCTWRNPYSKTTVFVSFILLLVWIAIMGFCAPTQIKTS